MIDTDDLSTWNYLRHVAAEEVMPLGMHVDITYRCDLSCVHCYLADRRRAELTVEEYRRFFAELADLGGLFLLVSGGDPFVRPDALDILRAAAEHRFDMTLITHAMSIDETKADQLKAMGIRRVSVSVYHADPAIHDRITRKHGSFERTIAGVRRLVSRGVEVNVKTPIMSLNLGAERVMPKLADELGVLLELSANVRGGNDGSDELLALNMTSDDKANVYGCIFGTRFQLADLATHQLDDRACNAAHNSAYLGPDGVVQPCLDYEESAGTIREQSFTEIWRHSPLLNRLRRVRRRDFTDCQSCADISLCALCPALSARETGSPTGRVPSRCRETEAVRRSFEKNVFR